jgi:hypothetical protein
MNEGYTLIPRDEVKTITFPFIEEDFITGIPVVVKYKYIVTSYKYKIREDMFIDDIVTFDILFYLGTSYYPRKTVGNKFSSTTLSIQFTTKVKDKNILGDKMWDYVYSIENMNAEQLINLNYKTYLNPDLQSEEEEDVIKIFKTITYL